MAVSAAGSYLESQEQAKNVQRMQNAKNQAYAENMARQRQYADEAGAAFTPTVQQQGAEGLNQSIEQSTAERLKVFNDNRISAPDYSPATNNAPKNVALAQEQAFGEAEANAERDNTNLARLGGYGGGLFNTGLTRNNYARAFGNLSDKAGRDVNLMPLDMDAASTNAYKSPSLFPTLLKAGGAAGSMYGAGGGSFWDQYGGVPSDGSYGPGYQPGLFTQIGGYL
jgi:hypothetical protein